MRSPEPCHCGRHEMRTVAEIGDWYHGNPESPTVRELAARPTTWTKEHSEMPREELRARIEAAGEITCEYALEALADGTPCLLNGVHRWAVADELGIVKVPVLMINDRQESFSAWAL